MRMLNVTARHDDVDGHSSGSEHSLDKNLGIFSVRTHGLRRLHAEKRALGSSAEPCRPRRNMYPVDKLIYDGYVAKHFVFMAKVAQDVEPSCFEEVAENVKWQEAMNEEMDALYNNEMWELVPLLKGKKTIGCRWVYKVKHNNDGSVSRYKARLVAKRYAQTYGIDYEKTFALVAKMATIKPVIAVAVAKDADHTLYVQKTDAGIVIITIYVDDLIIGGDALKDVEHVKALLRKQFDMKDLGELRYFLGIEMIRNEGGIWLSQKKYGLDMLMKCGMADCKPISTPLD
ncbi:hypothetical protein L7F22_068425 [Adiantum nelumboides]|nr:hypothetical protein [Adiantum nelumboides]